MTPNTYDDNPGDSDNGNQLSGDETSSKSPSAATRTPKDVPRNSRLLNAARSGRRMSPLTLGSLPKGYQRQERGARQFRTWLEDWVTEERGAISPADALLIDEASECHLLALICGALLRTKHDVLTPREIHENAQAKRDAKADRNEVVTRLGLSQGLGAETEEEREDRLWNVAPEYSPEQLAEWAAKEEAAAQAAPEEEWEEETEE